MEALKRLARCTKSCMFLHMLVGAGQFAWQGLGCTGAAGRAFCRCRSCVWLVIVVNGSHGAVQMRDIVRQLAQLFPTAIISGRGREKLENFVQLKEMFYAGSHGLDIVGPRVSSSRALLHSIAQVQVHLEDKAMVSC